MYVGLVFFRVEVGDYVYVVWARECGFFITISPSHTLPCPSIYSAAPTRIST